VGYGARCPSRRRGPYLLSGGSKDSNLGFPSSDTERGADLFLRCLPRVVSIFRLIRLVRGHPPTTPRLLLTKSRTVPTGDEHCNGVLKILRPALPLRGRPFAVIAWFVGWSDQGEVGVFRRNCSRTGRSEQSMRKLFTTVGFREPPRGGIDQSQALQRTGAPHAHPRPPRRPSVAEGG
jgi:hypothetical protein